MLEKIEVTRILDTVGYAYSDLPFEFLNVTEVTNGNSDSSSDRNWFTKAYYVSNSFYSRIYARLDAPDGDFSDSITVGVYVHVSGRWK